MKQSKRKSRKIILPDKLFVRIWSGAEKFNDKSEFIRAFTMPGSKEYINFPRKYSIEYEDAIILLDEIFEKNKLSVKEILTLEGKKKSEAARTFCIPIRTMEDWYAGKSSCATYIRLMMLRQYHLLNLGKYIYWEAEEEYRTTFPEIYRKRKKDEQKKADEEDEFMEIDTLLQSIRMKREGMLSREQSESPSILARTQFIDDIINRKRSH